MIIYSKRGQKTFRERKLVNEIENKLRTNPSLATGVETAKNLEELIALHKRIVPDDIEFEMIDENKDTKSESGSSEGVIEPKVESNAKETIKDEEDDSDNQIIDPMNREQPIVRDYVMNEQFGGENGGATNAGVDGGTRKFDEPMTFKDAFEIPDLDDDESKSDSTKSNAGSEMGGSKSTQSTKKPNEKPPVNPSFDDMDKSGKNKSSKKFAKYIVEAVCALAEKGFVWWANKDINDNKLAEYEINDIIDLNILVTLNNGQQATVRQFFQMQCIQAQQVCRFDDTQKKDLTESLAAVLLEKGVAPTPTQELMMVAAGIFVPMGAQIFAIKMGTNALLDQLKEMHQPSAQVNRSYSPPQPPPPPQPDAQYQPPVQEEVITKNEVHEFDELAPSLRKTEPKEETIVEQIENVVETKE